MKKLSLILAGAMMALSLAACSPTEVAPESKPQGAQTGPVGISKEEIIMNNRNQVDPKLTPDPNAVAMETIFVYYANEAGTGLDRVMTDVDSADCETVIATLIEVGVLGEDVTLNSWEITGGVKPGPGVDPATVSDEDRVGVLDVSGLEADADKFTLYALGNTFCESFELDKLEILVDGAAYENSLITDGYVYFEDGYKTLK